MVSYYTVLGADKTDSLKTIKKKYRELALKYHPDRGSESNEEKFKEIGIAWGVLSDPEKRKAYDLHGNDWERHFSEKPQLFTCTKFECKNQFEKGFVITENGMERRFCSRQHAQDYLDFIKRQKEGELGPCQSCGSNHKNTGIPPKCEAVFSGLSELKLLSYWNLFTSDKKNEYQEDIKNARIFCYDLDECKREIEKVLKRAEKENKEKKNQIDQERKEYIEKLRGLKGWNLLGEKRQKEIIEEMERCHESSQFSQRMELVKEEIKKISGEGPDKEPKKKNEDYEKLQYEIQKAIQEIENELNREPKIPFYDDWRDVIQCCSNLDELRVWKNKTLGYIQAIRKKQGGQNQNHNLTEFQTYTISQINQELNKNPPVSASELTILNWETEINQAQSEKAIAAIKSQVLVDIKNKRAAKKEANQITELLAQAQQESNWNNYQNLANILQQIKKYRSSDVYSAKKTEIQAIENQLHELNPNDYKETNNNLLDQQLKNNGLNENNMDEKIKQVVAEAKANPTPEKIAQAEEAIAQNGTDNKLDNLLTQIENQLKKGNLNEKDKQQLIEKLIEFTVGKDAFCAKAYLKKKSKVDALLAELRGEKNHNSEKPGLSWPKKVGIAALVILPLIIVILLLLRRRKRLERRR